jgi:hypothetical protein
MGGGGGWKGTEGRGDKERKNQEERKRVSEAGRIKHRQRRRREADRLLGLSLVACCGGFGLRRALLRRGAPPRSAAGDGGDEACEEALPACFIEVVVSGKCQDEL